MGTWINHPWQGKLYIEEFNCDKYGWWCTYNFCKDIRRIRHSKCKYCTQWKKHEPKRNPTLIKPTAVKRNSGLRR